MGMPSLVMKATANPNAVRYLYPDNLLDYDLIKYERGGIAVGDGTQGINGWTWTSQYEPLTGDVRLLNIETGISYLVFTLLGIFVLDFAFDSNMRPVVVYELEDGSAYYRWFDPTINNYTTTTLPAGTLTPRCCHDDKRSIGQSQNYSDVLIFYVLDNKVYNRIQRERYLQSHQVATLTPGATLKRVGMCTDLRIRIEIDNGTLISSP